MEVAARRVHEERIGRDVAVTGRKRRRAGVRELHAVRRRLVVGRGSVSSRGIAPDDRVVSRREAVQTAADQGGIAVDGATVEGGAVYDAGFAGRVAVDEAADDVAEADGRAVAKRRVAVDLAVLDVRPVDRAAPALAARDDAVLQVDAVGRRAGIILVPAVAQGEADEGEVLRAVVVVHADVGAAAVDDRLRRASRGAERHGGETAAPHADRRVGAGRDEHSFASADPPFRLLEGLERRLGRSRAVRRAVDGVDVELLGYGDFPLGVDLSVGPERVGHLAHERMPSKVCVGGGEGPACAGGRDERVVEIPAVAERRAFGVVRRNRELLAVAREDEHLVRVRRDRVDDGTLVRVRVHGERKGLPDGVAVRVVRHKHRDQILSRVVLDSGEKPALREREVAFVREARDHIVVRVGEVAFRPVERIHGVRRPIGVGHIRSYLVGAVGETDGVVGIERRGELDGFPVARALPDDRHMVRLTVDAKFRSLDIIVGRVRTFVDDNLRLFVDGPGRPRNGHSCANAEIERAKLRETHLVVLLAEPRERERESNDGVVLVGCVLLRPVVADHDTHVVVEGAALATCDHRIRQAPRRFAHVAGAFELHRIRDGLRRGGKRRRFDLEVCVGRHGDGSALLAFAVGGVVGRDPVEVVRATRRREVEVGGGGRGAEERRGGDIVGGSAVDAVLRRIRHGLPRERNAFRGLGARAGGDGRGGRAGDDAALVAAVVDDIVLDAAVAREICRVREVEAEHLAARVDGGRARDQAVVAVRGVDEPRIGADEVGGIRDVRADAGTEIRVLGVVDVIRVAAAVGLVAGDDVVEEVAGFGAADVAVQAYVSDDGGVVDFAVIEAACIAAPFVCIGVARDQAAHDRRIGHAAGRPGGDAVRDDAVLYRAAGDAARVVVPA